MPGILCVIVCDDGLRCAADWPSCTGPQRCIDEGGCFWRKYHGIPPDKLTARKCEPVPDEELDD